MQAVLVPALYLGPGSPAAFFPLGLLSLQRVLSQAGHDCRICVPSIDPVVLMGTASAIQDWAAAILATKPDCVGLSTTCDSYPHDLLLVRAIKEQAPLTRVVLGGPQASIVAEESMAAFPWIDYVLRGEAEGTIIAFARVVDGNGGPETVPGLTYRDRGRIHSNPPAPLLEEMDVLDLPDYGAYPRFEDAVWVRSVQPAERFLPLEAGRGCPYGCVFCSTSAYWHRRRRQKSPGHLSRQMRSLVYGCDVDAVALVQDLFAVEGTWLTEFLQALEDGAPVRWSCSLRPDSVTVETLRAMRSAGCSDVFLGVESGSERTQKLIGKHIDISSTVRIVEAAVSCGIRVITSLIVGFPWETRRDLQETLSLHKHFLDVGVQQSSVKMLSPLPKAPITVQYAEKLRLDSFWGFDGLGLDVLEHAEIERMIREYPRIFSSFYHIESESVPREELCVALWAANALQEVTQA